MSDLREWSEEVLRLLGVLDTFGEAFQAKGAPLKGWFLTELLLAFSSSFLLFQNA